MALSPGGYAMTRWQPTDFGSGRQHSVQDRHADRILGLLGSEAAGHLGRSQPAFPHPLSARATERHQRRSIFSSPITTRRFLAWFLGLAIPLPSRLGSRGCVSAYPAARSR
jgi:hypothetical protein